VNESSFIAINSMAEDWANLLQSRKKTTAPAGCASADDRHKVPTV